MSATNLLELTPDELVARVEEWGEAGYRGRQVAAWIYQRGVTDFAVMSNLPKSLRGRLLREAVVQAPQLDERVGGRGALGALAARGL